MASTQLKPDALLGQIEDLLRRVPDPADVRGNPMEHLAYVGQVVAAITTWDPVAGARARAISSGLRDPMGFWKSFTDLIQLLHEAHADLRLRVVGPISTAVGAGMVYDYFDELRKLIEPARSDLFFIDPYLDADFVSRYLQGIGAGTPVRLLARERLGSLVPAAKALGQQRGSPLQVRSHPGFHDRYVIVDGAACYQSGASFKDGGLKPTTITQIADAFPAVRQTYEDLWAAGKVEL